MSKARLVLRAANRSSLPIIDAVVARERPPEPLVCLRYGRLAASSFRSPATMRAACFRRCSTLLLPEPFSSS